MSQYFDDLETRSQDAREAAHLAGVNAQLRRIGAQSGAYLQGISPLTDLAELAKLPVLRKSELLKLQGENPPFGGVPVQNITHIFQSPGPIYEPCSMAHDWWRLGRFAHAVGIGRSDLVQNCFAYHFTPAGAMFESAAHAVGARVFPAGTGQTELQLRAAKDLAVTAYAGTPDYLKVLLDKAETLGIHLDITKAAVSGGALFPSLRQEYAARGIQCLQCYATADLGNIAYESAAMEGMILDEHVIVEIVTPGTGTPVPEGEVGEVVVTSLNPDYPLVRFGTGDLSALMPGVSPCGRSNKRIKGWMGRADQTAKVKGMFVRPEQVAQFVDHFAQIQRARMVISRANEQDTIALHVESAQTDATAFTAQAREIFKLGIKVEICAPNSLARDGIVIEDQRSYD